jgi:outer membrane protein assembly factor BamC
MRLINVLLLVSMAASCGWFGGGTPPNTAYMQIEPLQPLKIPSDLDDGAIKNPIPLPVIPEQRNPSFYPKKPPLPDALYASDNRDEVRLQALGSRNWLVVPEPPTTAWPKMKQFFADNGVVIDSDRPEEGRLNTSWLMIEDKDYRDVVRTLLRNNTNDEAFGSSRDRFLIRVEQGLQPQSTEVHIRHENDGKEQITDDDIIVFDGLTSNIRAVERSLLNEIGGYIAARVAETTVSKVALQIGASAKTDLIRNADGVPVLRLYLDQDRAWASLEQAMKNAEVEINDQDRETGEYDVTIPTAIFTGESAGGFFCRITFSCGGANSVDALIKMSAHQEAGFNVVVIQNGEPMLDVDQAQQILVMIREFAT